MANGGVTPRRDDGKGAKGRGRTFAQKVDVRRKEIMRQRPELTARDAFLLATDSVIREDRQALSDYRSDVEQI